MSTAMDDRDATLRGAVNHAIAVTVAGDDDKADWDAFVAARPDGSFYHLYDWKRVNEQSLGHRCEFLIARASNGDVHGVLPLVLVKSRTFGAILCSMPFVNFGGPLATSAGIASQLVQRACKTATDSGADYLELRCAASVETDLPASLRKISMTIALAADPEAIWKNFSSKHRTNVRRAQKNNLVVQSGGNELLNEFYNVMEQSWQGLGTPLYSIAYFRHIVATFGDRVRIHVCRLANEPIAVAFNGHSNGTVEGMWAGALPEHRNLQPNYVLYWEMIRDACANGFQHFHLGRSTVDSGAEQFKSKWNAEARQLYWYFHRPDGGAMPELNVDNPKYKLAIQVWRRLPLWATRAIGPRVARNIP